MGMYACTLPVYHVALRASEPMPEVQSEEYEKAEERIGRREDSSPQGAVAALLLPSSLVVPVEADVETVVREIRYGRSGKEARFGRASIVSFVRV